MTRVAVVGAGIAGLAAAYELTKHGVTPIVFDADTRAGGKVRTERFGDVMVDTGPDAFLARRPEAVELCEELGLRPRLEPPAATHAYVYARGRLRTLPTGLVLGVPTDPVALARSGILSGWAVVRAALEPYLRGSPLGEDEALGTVTRRRFGNEVTDKLVDPLLGGINAGDVDELSIDLIAPQIAAAARTDRSLTRALQGAPKPPTSNDPVFFTIPGGMESLVDALLKAITAAGGEVRRNDPVSSISATEVASRSGTTDVLGVVLATPSYVSALLLEPVAPGVAGTLRSIPYASVCMVLLSYDERDMGRSLDASGYLVPRSEGLLITAASWASTKWSHLARPGRVLIRASAGRFGDDRAMAMTDDELVRRVHADLVTTMQVRSEPIESSVVRWKNAFPQYPPGHRGRIDAALAALPPGVTLAGAALRGVGLPACIGTGRDAARAVLGSIGYNGS
ncbi:MAG TPA: protoporphyrinogen oxidase [Acidimicrobiales bacterium]|nr:protoporphyrinogen oxidase [Acidimicrobiales bacterium]